MNFLARYRGATLRADTQDLRYLLRWCAERAVEPLLAQRPQLELYLRWMQQQGGGAGDDQPAIHHPGRFLPLRGHRRALPEGPVAGGDAPSGGVAGPAPHRLHPSDCPR